MRWTKNYFIITKTIFNRWTENIILNLNIKMFISCWSNDCYPPDTFNDMQTHNMNELVDLFSTGSYLYVFYFIGNRQ